MDIQNWIMDIHNWIMDIHNWSMDIHNWIMDIQFIHNQSGTKPNMVAKILATNFGVFLVIYVMFSKTCSMCL